MSIPNQHQCRGCTARFIVDGSAPDITVNTTVAPGSNGQCSQTDQGCVQSRECNFNGEVNITIDPNSTQIYWLDGNLILLGAATATIGPVKLQCGAPEQLVATVTDILGAVIDIYAKCDACANS